MQKKTAPRKRAKKTSVQDTGALVQQVLDAMSSQGFSARALDGLQNLMTGMGSVRDKRMYNSYAEVVPLDYATAGRMWRSNWLAKNIVEARGNDMLRAWVDMQWNGREEDLDRQKKIDKAEQQLQVRSKFQEAVNWGRLYGQGAVLMLVNDGKDLEEPLDPKSVVQGDLLGLVVYDRWQLAPTDLMDKAEDLYSPNFRGARFFILGGTEADAGTRVHWTRVLLFRGRKLPYREWLQNGMSHDSELQHVIDDVKDYNAVMANIATLVFDMSVDVLMVDKLAAMLAQPNGAQKVAERFDLAFTQKSANRALVLDGNDKYAKQSANFTGVGSVVPTFKDNVCAASRTPALKLFGESPGGLNATGTPEMKTYNESIAQDQEDQLRPVFDRWFEVFLRHVLGQVPDGFHFEFNPLDRESPTEKSNRESVDATRDATYIEALGPAMKAVVAAELKERNTYKMLEESHIKRIAAQSEKEEEAANRPPPAPVVQQAPPESLKE